jgi:hypothetical protein
LGFGREHESDDDDFTPLVSRRNKKKKKGGGKSGRWKGTPTKSGGLLVGAQSKSCAAQGKVNNVHPLSDIVTGPRCRKKSKIFMIGVSLNCRGVGKKCMSCFLSDFIREQDVELLGVTRDNQEELFSCLFQEY